MFQCDVCGSEGQRYQVIYEEGTRVLDRCNRHNRELEKFKEEPGEWLSQIAGRSTFRKSSPTDIKLALARGRQNNTE